jgi:tetratricopeptide (TPR) repeat protein
MPKDRELRRDLDNILLKALHKDPNRRYGSAEQFSADIERYLEGQPVSARPDTHFYKVNKFVRRHRSLVAGSVAFVVLLIGSTILVAWQAHVARVQRAVAERRFSDVRSLANWLVFDFHDRIEKLHGATEARQLLIQRALQYLDGLSHESAGDPGLQRELAQSYLKLGDVLGYPNDANLGDRKGALDSYGKALAILDGLAPSRAGTPAATPDVLRNIATVHQRIGEMLLKGGNTSEAFDQVMTGQKILEELVRSGRIDRSTRSDLAISYSKVGQSYESRGETTEALAQYKSAMELFQALHREAPDDPQASRNVTVAHSKLGDMDLAVGHLEDALANYRSSVEIRERLVAENPNNREAARDLATVYDRMSTVYQDQKRYEEALSYERKTLAIDLHALDRDPKDADTKGDVASDYSSIGDLASGLGRWSEALAGQQRALQIRKELHSQSPMDTDITAEMADSALYVGLAQAKLGKREAPGNLQMARSLIEELHQADPGNAMYHEELAKTYLFSGKAMEALGQRSAALAFYKKSMGVYQELKTQDKNSFEADARMEEAAKGIQSVSVSRTSETQD